MDTLSNIISSIISAPVGMVLVIIVLIIILSYWIYNFVIFYHLTRFGIGAQPKKIAAVFMLGSLLLFALAILLFFMIDFSAIQNSFALGFGSLGRNISSFNPNTI